jgi:hypothetical protein
LRVFDGTIDVEQQFRIIMQVASSTKEIGLNPKILAYPNPTKNMITLLYPAGLPKVQLIKIVDTLGKELQVINNPIFKETLLEIKLNDQIANGLIILWFIDSNGKTIANKKILVQ